MRRRVERSPVPAEVPSNQAVRFPEIVALFAAPKLPRFAVLMKASRLIKPVLEAMSVKDWFPVVEGRSRRLAMVKFPKERTVSGPVRLSVELLKT